MMVLLLRRQPSNSLRDLWLTIMATFHSVRSLNLSNSFALAVSNMNNDLNAGETMMPNGIRVVTESSPGAQAYIGVYVKAGSRNEDLSATGTSYLA